MSRLVRGLGRRKGQESAFTRRGLDAEEVVEVKEMGGAAKDLCNQALAIPARTENEGLR